MSSVAEPLARSRLDAKTDLLVGDAIAVSGRGLVAVGGGDHEVKVGV